MKQFQKRSGNFMNIDEIEYLCKQYNINNYSINPDGSIDVDGSVYLPGRNLEELPLTFNKVNGSFSCWANKLTTLKGSPKEVGGQFNCHDNQLITLEGAPKKVGRDFHCSHNQLISLEGAPEEVSWQFYCDNNKLTSLKGIGYVGWEISCTHNMISLTEIEQYINNKKYKLFSRDFTYEDYFNLVSATDEEKMLFKMRFL